MTGASDSTVAATIERAIDAYEALAELGEEVEDEWSYVTDLAAAWRERFAAVTDARGTETLDPAVIAAIDRAVHEIASIEDAHRAIDWLSTYPQLTLLALGERP